MSTKSLKPVSEKANSHRRSRAARRYSKLHRRLTVGLLLVAAVLGYIAHVNRADQFGTVGVVGNLAAGIDLSCGGTYQPESKAMEIFHPTLPCGSKVMVTSPETGRRVTATVVNRRVVFSGTQGRVADLTLATATALGLDTARTQPYRLSLRPLAGKLPGLLAVLPTWTHLERQAANTARYTKADVLALTNNMMGECASCKVYGRVAVAQVTLNRVEYGYRGQKTIHGVVYDSKQFSWSANPPRHVTNTGSRTWQATHRLAEVVLEGQTSGNLLGTQYLLADAVSYYQKNLIKRPGWAHPGNGLQLIPIMNTVENEAFGGHSFYEFAKMASL